MDNKIINIFIEKQREGAVLGLSKVEIERSFDEKSFEDETTSLFDLNRNELFAEIDTCKDIINDFCESEGLGFRFGENEEETLVEGIRKSQYAKSELFDILNKRVGKHKAGDCIELCEEGSNLFQLDENEMELS